MAQAIVPYPEICSGCRMCEMVCSLWHENVVNTEKSRIRVTKEGVRVDVPVVCTQGNACRQECAMVCPVECIREVEGTAIEVVEDECTGCGACIEACPFNCIWMKEDFATKCDLCHGDPMCVKVCPLEAVRFMDRPEGEAMKKWAVARKLAGGD